MALSVLDATQVVGRLQAAGLPVTGAVAYSAATDPNHLLGRPNEYTSKAAWVDTRAVDPGASAGAVGAGGGVEVFATAAGAMARARYIQTIATRIPIFDEYDYLAGPVLVRVSAKLTPTQAAAYGQAVGATLYQLG